MRGEKKERKGDVDVTKQVEIPPGGKRGDFVSFGDKIRFSQVRKEF